MSKFIVLLLAGVLPLGAWAHSGTDPLVELQKNVQSLTVEQESFAALDTESAQLDSLENQLRYLQKNVMILQDLITKEYPQVKTDMTRYKLDYLGAVSQNLDRFRRSVQQASRLVD